MKVIAKICSELIFLNRRVSLELMGMFLYKASREDNNYRNSKMFLRLES